MTPDRIARLHIETPVCEAVIRLNNAGSSRMPAPVWRALICAHEGDRADPRPTQGGLVNPVVEVARVAEAVARLCLQAEAGALG